MRENPKKNMVSEKRNTERDQTESKNMDDDDGGVGGERICIIDGDIK